MGVLSRGRAREGLRGLKHPLGSWVVLPWVDRSVSKRCVDRSSVGFSGLSNVSSMRRVGNALRRRRGSSYTAAETCKGTASQATMIDSFTSRLQYKTRGIERLVMETMHSI